MLSVPSFKCNKFFFFSISLCTFVLEGVLVYLGTFCMYLCTFVLEGVLVYLCAYLCTYRRVLVIFSLEQKKKKRKEFIEFFFS